MKIAMLIDGRNPPIFGGGQVHVEELCKGLSINHGCDIDLFVRKLKGSDGLKYEEDSINGKWRIYRIGPTTKFFNIFGRICSLIFTSFYLLYKTIKEKYDIIHAHAYVSGIPAKIVGFLTSTPVVYTVHGTNGLDVKNASILSKLESFLVCKIKYDLEISVSERLFKYRNMNKNIKIIYNGVDLSRMNHVVLDKKYKGINFIWVGRYEWTKGLDYLIEAINLLDRPFLEKTGFHLNLIGDGILLNDVKLKAENFGLSKFISFKGKLFGDDLIREYKANHIFILPSVTEGQPLTLLEAMACGLPVLVTDVGDNSNFVKNGKNGFIVNPGNEKELANSINKMLKLDNNILHSMGKINYEKSFYYSRGSVCAKVYGEYLKLLS